MYYRLYITYTLAGFLFDINQSNVCRDIERIEQLVRKYLPIPQKTHGLTKRLKKLQEVEKYFPDLMAFIDCTEQKIPRYDLGNTTLDLDSGQPNLPCISFLITPSAILTAELSAFVSPDVLGVHINGKMTGVLLMVPNILY